MKQNASVMMAPAVVFEDCMSTAEKFIELDRVAHTLDLSRRQW